MTGTQLNMFATAPSTGAVGQLVKLARNFDRANICCENLGIVGPGKGPHAAEVICEACGRHRAWLPQAALNFITEARAQCGAGAITLRSSTFPGEPTMARDTRQDDMTCVLFKNNRKRPDRKDPDYTGSAVLGGRQHFADAWINTSQKTGEKFMSVKFKPKDAPPAKTGKEEPSKDIDEFLTERIR